MTSLVTKPLFTFAIAP